jgi:hypothetical protein
MSTSRFAPKMTAFVLYPGHETEMIEWVVARTDRFLIVDKRPAAEPFVADDPRGAPSD